MDTTTPPRSRVYLREEKKSIRVANGLDKPEVPQELRDKWQRLIDLLCGIFGVPASLIMHMTDSDMEVFLSSGSEGNPYAEGAADGLGHGLYCETVIGRRSMLEVPDARENPDWKDNPDVKLGMVSYLGFPLLWPDGTAFGTICSLDSKKRRYDTSFKDLMEVFRDVIETDLGREVELRNLREDNAALDLSLREIHHRVRNHFFMVAGYVQVKREMSTDSETALFRDIENRIRAIGLIHENIYADGNLTPDTRSYVEALATAVTGDLTGSSVAVETDIEDIPLGKRLPSLGAVLVELITNSMKYAFGGIETPRIRISLKRDGGMVRLSYTDNGVGFEGEVSEGLGTMIFRNFTASLRGNLSVSGIGGYSAEFVIPVTAIAGLA